MPEPRLDRLARIAPDLPVLAWCAASDAVDADRKALGQALAPFYPDSEALSALLERLISEKQLSSSGKGRHLRLSGDARAGLSERLGDLSRASWAEIRERRLAAIALGLDPTRTKVRAYLARKENLESAALGRLYGVSEDGALPTRPRVRHALLRALILARMPECEPAFTETPMQNTSRDVIGRTIMLGAAGLEKGTMRDAESALLRKALNLSSESKEELIEALIRASLGKNAPRLPARIRVEVESKKQDLTDFAATVRDLAKTQQTAPFAGRVAIAQVYDAGISRGLNFGSLDEFKSKVASACRAGLLDLERYDIAGPMDSALRERSRTAFGRDERHFIVNEWI